MGAEADEVVRAERSAFGRLADGRTIEAVALSSPAGVTARIITLGATLQALTAPDRDGGNHLHGGEHGFDRRIWRITGLEQGDPAHVVLEYVSADGEGGYPGNLTATATYRLDRCGELTIERVRAAHPQLRLGRGYDHNYVIDGDPGTLRPAARLEDPRSGRVLELLTTAPGVQLYSGNFLDATVTGKHGRMYRQGDAICLEPQTYPDARNRPAFPSPRLDPGDMYRNVIVYRVSMVSEGGAASEEVQ